MEHLNHGVKSRIPQAPWVLYFDGASRKPAAHGGLGVVLRNSKGQIVEEERKFLGAGISSGLAKYKALLAGLKKAKSLQVKHLLAKGNSRILINQVVGRWTTRDSHLRDQLKKVWVICKEFDSLFMEFIPKEHNVHADRIANAAIDKELQIQEVVSNYFDRSTVAWQGPPQQKEPAPVSPPARILTPFSNLKLRPVSPFRQAQSIKDTGIISPVISTGIIIKPLASALKRSTNVPISQRRIPVTDDVQTSDESDLTRTIKSLTSTTKADKFWADRLSISDEASSSTASEEEGYFKPFLENVAGIAAAASARGSGDDSGEDAYEEEQEFCKPHGSGAALNIEDPTASAASAGGSTIQLSEADCDHLVQAVLERLKKTRLAPNLNDTSSCLQHHL